MARSFKFLRGYNALIKSANEYTKEDLEALALKILNSGDISK
jgi:hypothetical protein